MNIPETFSYDKEGKVERFPLFKKLFLSATIILVASLSFGIGRLSVVGDREPIKIEYDEQLITDNRQPTTSTSQTATVINTTEKKLAPPSVSSDGGVVVSKNGIRYHYLHCSGAKQIKEENKIFFATPEAAEAAGYSLAANCSPK
ncbi:MAG: hypothetical protein COV96_00515 [Candidatus Zambryskibacteria bacterium CG11_big_fil_rev_8_21_14_0_20_42_18]|uniref:Ada DNA repair metal-binding domain-containing protein n=1 Tax=Candidatus Zambryskibacteria bacterium CG_4_9_14_3_um_filter_42_15 TaxID=1975112 RepID=A0A2M7WRN1_9BACT|nr:MAG: hypothetical protein COV96_00515 [Candidatus Zambryskibacteria bacterium CG11_big_fil_rev_8_21_14_0_20_42_18]PJA32669.1 MAG: hypothetical protein CO185_02125 [Candidatus Zambryskibacteria bacterium CG_4_9_14_3_um_filter_42_15]